MQLQPRYQAAKTIPGTRDNHCFVPHLDGLHVCRVSPGDDSGYRVVAEAEPMRFIAQVGQYVASLYDGKWWVGYVLDRCEEQEDAQVRFMHPNGPAVSFKWPTTNDICWVPNAHILMAIPSPSTTRRGRHYSLDEETSRKITQAFEKYKT